MDRITAYAFARAFEGHRLRDLPHAALAGGVRRAIRHANIARERGDVDDRTACLAPPHVDHGRPASQENAGEIRAQLQLEIPNGQRLDGLQDRATGIVDKNVERAEFAAYRAEHRRPMFFVGDVLMHSNGSVASLAQLLGTLRDLRAVEIGQHHLCALAGERARRGEAHAGSRCGPGDQRRLSLNASACDPRDRRFESEAHQLPAVHHVSSISRILADGTPTKRSRGAASIARPLRT